MLLLIPLLLVFGSWRGTKSYPARGLHLEDFQWYFRSPNGSIQGRVQVPGDIYQGLLAANYIPNPLFGNNDRLLQWVPRIEWIYYTSFTIPENWSGLLLWDTNDFSEIPVPWSPKITVTLVQAIPWYQCFTPTFQGTPAVQEYWYHGATKVKAVLLNAQGLDTVANVYLNDILVLEAKNQFVPYMVPVKWWKIGENNLRIEFKSPVNYARQKSDEYEKQFGHVVPPVCPVSEFRGECHVNFMRKIQASFSWDWGPSFPTVGISEPLSLEGVETIFVDRISAAVSFKKQFIVSLRMTVWSAVKAELVLITIAIPEISITDQFTVALNPMSRNILERRIMVPERIVERWWPNGSGKQKLYDLTATLTYHGQDYHSKPIRIGFRTIELVQDYVDSHKPSMGRHFYFKINGRPLFLKGSNWIPLSAFPARNHRFREKFLLESARQANMNALRVWGGGRYETDRFYDLADEMGLLIWQDMMFACALYPVDKQYLESVRGEVHAQVERLRHHASIFLWAGNNENELAVRQWFSVARYSMAEMVADYMKLYNETVRPVIEEVDGTRPYLLSSPTNGIQSEKEGGVAYNPGDEKYGDIHFYNEMMNLWKDYTYQIPRCSSEYGVQSYPRKETMLKWLNESDWLYTSESMRRRQHHPGGFAAQLAMIFSHFKIPKECGNDAIESCNYVRTKSFMDRFVYLSQFHQAIAYQTQTEHYRIWRGRLMEDGRGNTMCALYWQLNDLWAAPTWSTVDYELSWKPAHYFARRFFASVILSMVVDQNIHLFAVSDLVEPILNATVILDVYSSFDRFSPVDTFGRNVAILPQSSTKVEVHDGITRKIRETMEHSVCILRGKLLLSNGTQIGYDTIHLPDKLFKVSEENFGKAWIRKMHMKSSTQYELELEADKIAPLVYMELAPGLAGWFSDNAFTMVEPRKTVLLTLFKEPKSQLTTNDVNICSLRNCGIGNV